jgi:hypothetical protein
MGIIQRGTEKIKKIKKKFDPDILRKEQRYKKDKEKIRPRYFKKRTEI